MATNHSSTLRLGSHSYKTGIHSCIPKAVGSSVRFVICQLSRPNSGKIYINKEKTTTPLSVGSYGLFSLLFSLKGVEPVNMVSFPSLSGRHFKDFQTPRPLGEVLHGLLHPPIGERIFHGLSFPSHRTWGKVFWVKFFHGLLHPPSE